MPNNVNNEQNSAMGISIDDISVPQTNETDVVNNPNVVIGEQPIVVEPQQESQEQGPMGLTAAELNDPNSIKVTISDPATPIVVLYGPPSCGKTMTLVRMTRYLLSQGYTVVPDNTFRPSYDYNYKELCDNFDQMINSNDAASSTSNISFMLVKVMKNGRPVCQLLEAPGEYYFNVENPNRAYPAYVNEIINCVNRKVWAIMVEPNWSDSVPRANYVTRIRNLKSMMSTRDRVVFVCNKIDKTPYVRGLGVVDVPEAIRYIQNLYPSIFVPFENKNPITKFFTKFNCDFVPFMTGSYSDTISGGHTYTEGHYLYAQRLWQAMLKAIKG